LNRRTLLHTTTLLISLLPALLFAQEGDSSINIRGITEVCKRFNITKCDAEQESLLRLYLGNVDLYGLSQKLDKAYEGKPPAFEVLPKDRAGFPNWNKAVTDGIIRPKGSLTGEIDEHESFFENLMVFRTKIPQIPDVIFPHGMHTYWVGCDSCHPKPFKEQRGANNFTMGSIIEGEFCGKCHGKVAFPPASFANCSRCHILQKTKQKVWSEPES
jgi:c(7)-type cytochrome triheme protein